MKWANYQKNKEVQFDEQKHPFKKHFNGRLILFFYFVTLNRNRHTEIILVTLVY